MNKGKKSNNSKKNMTKISLKALENSTEEDDNQENSEECFLKNCTRCKKDFHSECYYKTHYTNKKASSKPKTNNRNFSSKNLNSLINLQIKNICNFCQEKIKKESESMKISDFFKAQKKTNSNSACKSKISKRKISNENIEIPSKAQNSLGNDVILFDFEKKNENIAVYPKFILWKPLPKESIELLKENLKHALIFKNIEFSDDLAFLDLDCPEEMNNAKLEPGIQKMSSHNKVIFYKFKERTRLGEYPGLEIIQDPLQV